MNVQQRIELLVSLGDYMQQDSEEWAALKQKAYLKNQWFIPPFIELAITNIATSFCKEVRYGSSERL